MILPAVLDWRGPMEAHALRRDVGVAGACLSFRSDSRRALDAVIRSVVGLPVPAAAARRLVVAVSTAAEPFLEGPLRAPAGGQVHPRVRLGDGREILGAAWPASGMLAFVDRPSNRGCVVVHDPEEIGLAEAVTLVRALVAWWLADDEAGLVHAAAVAGPAGAVLLTGAGGAGKSSTAAAALVGGFDFIGDDSVFCRADTLEVFCVNTCLSLYEEDFAVHNRALGPTILACDGKAAADVAVLAPDRLRPVAPIRAVVAVERAGGNGPGLRPASRGRILASVAPSSVFIVPNDERRTISMVASLLRRVPCYVLGLEPERARVAAALRPLLRGEDAP